MFNVHGKKEEKKSHVLCEHSPSCNTASKNDEFVKVFVYWHVLNVNSIAPVGNAMCLPVLLYVS